jgi:hypothetical protein
LIFREKVSVHFQKLFLLDPVVVAVEGVEARNILFKNRFISKKVRDILPLPPLLREGSMLVS